jgi:hypothetical protein
MGLNKTLSGKLNFDLSQASISYILHEAQTDSKPGVAHQLQNKRGAKNKLLTVKTQHLHDVAQGLGHDP